MGTGRGKPSLCHSITVTLRVTSIAASVLRFVKGNKESLREDLQGVKLAKVLITLQVSVVANVVDSALCGTKGPLLMSLPACLAVSSPPWEVQPGPVPRPHLEHVHHLPEVRRPEPRSLLHGEALEILDDAETINLGFLILQQLLQDEAICLQDLKHRVNWM